MGRCEWRCGRAGGEGREPVALPVPCVFHQALSNYVQQVCNLASERVYFTLELTLMLDLVVILLTKYV